MRAFLSRGGFHDSGPDTRSELRSTVISKLFISARSWAWSLSAILAIVMMSLTASAHARASMERRGTLISLTQQSDIGASAAAAAASAASGGQVLGVKRRRSGQSVMYSFKVLLP